MKNQAYFDLLYKLSPARTPFGRFLELDLSSDNDNYRLVVEKFGGEENFRELFPSTSNLIKNAKIFPPKTQTPGLAPEGLADALIIYEAFKKDQNLEAPSLVSLTAVAERLYLLLTIFVNGVQVAAKNDFVYNKSTSRLTAEVPDFKAGDTDIIKVVLHASWQEKGSNKLRSVISSDSWKQADFILRDVVASSVVNDPRHIKTGSTDPIKVTYARLATDADYCYPEGRTCDNQKVYLDGSGSVKLKQGVSFASATNDYMLLMQNDEKGAIFYNGSWDGCFQKTDDGFSWKLEADWKNVIPNSAIAGYRSYAYILNINFKTSDGETYSYTVSSVDVKDPNPNYNLISDILLQWGCFAKGTLITMAEGGKKVIEEITEGEFVKTSGGGARVKACAKGDETKVYVLVTDKGETLELTKGHPVLTDCGPKDVDQLTGEERLVMEDGSFGHIYYLYTRDYSGKVYNISLEGEEHIVYANGFAAGDYVLQNAAKPAKESSKVTPEVLAEGRAFASLWGNEHDA
ncbi:MAG: hypothetical protein LBQ88_19300 [Treponema sp.]|jgi:hypothetical protein|nr:hypothetical protein [Treponema sp.]